MIHCEQNAHRHLTYNVILLYILLYLLACHSLSPWLAPSQSRLSHHPASTEFKTYRTETLVIESVDSISRDGQDIHIICNTLQMTQNLRIGNIQFCFTLML